MNEQETLYFPCAESEITRTLCRLGATQPEKFTATLIATDDDISPAVRSVFEGEYPLTEHLKTLNALSKCLQLFDAQTLDKFHTVFDTIWPDTPEEILWIAENIYDFTVIPGISNAEEYGQHLIQVSGHFEVKSELDSYIDYQKFGEHYIKKEGGVLGDRGYVAYLGNKPEIEAIVIRRITAEQNTQDFQLRGFS